MEGKCGGKYNSNFVANLARSTSEVGDLPQRPGVKLDCWHRSNSKSFLQLGGFVHIDLPSKLIKGCDRWENLYC